jgi:Bacterial antitoxin of type II TA system, VapB
VRRFTTLKIDNQLVREAQKLGNHRTKKDAVTAALVEYVRRLKQQEIVSLFGTIDYDPAYDYKGERHRRPRS